mmetsp:Transcript_128829/g.222627  ORF Transcript_128829/g.222627 Transcript_128829/m.222627 type:complete len:81 (-) Transcript_128829:149-391(-)
MSKAQRSKDLLKASERAYGAALGPPEPQGLLYSSFLPLTWFMHLGTKTFWGSSQPDWGRLKASQHWTAARKISFKSCQCS